MASLIEALEPRRLLSFTTITIPDATREMGAGGSPYILTARKGVIWISDPFDPRILRYTAAGAFQEFDLDPSIDPAFIAKGPGGTLWFSDRGKGAIGRLTPSGQVKEFPIPKASDGLLPDGITAGADGNLWFLADDSGSPAYVARITPSGNITPFALHQHGGIDPSLTPGPDGNLWFHIEGQSDVPGKIGRVSMKGDVTYFPLDNGVVTGIAAGKDGNIYFADNAIERVAPSGQIASLDNTPGLTDDTINPAETYFGTSGIVCGPDGALWFLASNNLNPIPAANPLVGDFFNQLGRIAPGGSVSAYQIPGDSTGSFNLGAIAFDSSGTLWCIDAQATQLVSTRLRDDLLAGGIALHSANGDSTSITVAHFRDFGGDSNPQDFSASVTWPDGSTSAGDIVRDRHTGSLNVTAAPDLTLLNDLATVTITDNHTGQTATAISVGAVKTSGLTSQGLNLNAVAGQAFSGPVADINGVVLNSLSNYTAQINWGDSTTLGTLEPDGNGGAYVVGTFRFSHSGTYSITSSADSPAGYTLATGAATVGAGALEGEDQTLIVPPNQAFNDTVAAFSVPAGSISASHYHATFQWRSPLDDSNQTLTATVAPEGTGGLTVSVALPDLTNSLAGYGMFEFQVSVTDDRTPAGQDNVVGVSHGLVVLNYPASGVSDIYTRNIIHWMLVPFTADTYMPIYPALAEQVIASPLPLAVTALVPFSDDVGTYNGIRSDAPVPSYTPPTPPDPNNLQGVIRWGDGTQSAASFVLDSQGVMHVRGDHTYAQSGNYSVTVDVVQSVSSVDGQPFPYGRVHLPTLRSTVTVS